MEQIHDLAYVRAKASPMYEIVANARAILDPLKPALTSMP
jgi:hypothetical protein